MRFARMHHYQLGHLALRGCCQGNPPGFFRSMASDDWEAMIRFLWDQVCARCDPHEATDIQIEDLRVLRTRLGDHPALLFELPEAKEPTEAIYVAIVLLIDVSELGTAEQASFRYFTLERGHPLEGRPCTVLCEWDDDAHTNLGEGPEPSLDAFAEAIAPLL